MKSEIAKIKKALSRQSIVRHLSFYLVRDNYIYASDGRFTAGVPFECDRAFLVSGEELEKFLARLPEEGEISVGIVPSMVHLRQGPFHCTIRTLAPDEYTLIAPDHGKWEAPPRDFVESLRKARSFVSDNAQHEWALCVSLGFGVMRATNNVAVVEVDCFGLDGRDVLLPCWAVDYILERSEVLTNFQLDPNAASFQWEDKSWMRTQLVQGAFPAQVASVLSKVQRPTWAIPPEWREAYGTVAALADDVVKLEAHCMKGKYGEAVVSHDTETPVPEGEEASYWNPKYAAPVIEHATHWQVDAWPAPCSFIGEGLRGLVVGRRP